MAKKTLSAVAEDASPEIQFSVKPGLGEVTITLGGKTRIFIEGELCGCTRGEWYALAQSDCFDLAE